MICAEKHKLLGGAEVCNEARSRKMRDGFVPAKEALLQG